MNRVFQEIQTVNKLLYCMIQIYTDSAVTSKRLKMLQSNSKYIEMIVPSNRTIYVMVYFQRFQVDVVSYELHM